MHIYIYIYIYTGSAGFDTHPYPLAYAFFSFFPVLFFFHSVLPPPVLLVLERERAREGGREGENNAFVLRELKHELKHATALTKRSKPNILRISLRCSGVYWCIVQKK
jgi:hypothetical protein